MTAADVDVIEFLREREQAAYKEWKAALDSLLVKQDEWARARAAYHDELTHRQRMEARP